ncbi:MAG: thioredoxin domain-containing protein [Candidatus Competibacterales bacterium]
MKQLVLLLSLLVASPVFSAQAESDTPSTPPEVIGLLFYADWCGSCKVLDPKLSAVKPQFSGQPVLFTQVDMTDEFTVEQSTLFSSAMGVEAVFAEHAPKTGFMLLIDADDNAILDRLTKELSEAELAEKISQALEKAS